MACNLLSFQGLQAERRDSIPVRDLSRRSASDNAGGAVEGPMSWMPKNASVAMHDWKHPTSYAPSLVIDERQRSQNNGRCYAKAARENRAACSRLLCSKPIK